MKIELRNIDDRDTCPPTCGQDIDNQKAVVLKNDLQNKIYTSESNVTAYTGQIMTLEEELEKAPKCFESIRTESKNDSTF